MFQTLHKKMRAFGIFQEGGSTRALPTPPVFRVVFTPCRLLR